ncbi:MAG: hypothetical protein MI919_08465, partial [Holophagales bacterium]|nr:hypothetical protein [Holophagales bacterium]
EEEVVTDPDPTQKEEVVTDPDPTQKEEVVTDPDPLISTGALGWWARLAVGGEAGSGGSELEVHARAMEWLAQLIWPELEASSGSALVGIRLLDFRPIR